MNPITPYIFFNGHCREAMNFYKSIFGGELNMMTYKEAQGQGGCPEGAENRIIHAFLKSGNLMLMASDTPDEKLTIGDNAQLSLSLDSNEQIESIYKALSEKGTPFLPLHDAFWGARFGMLTDRYGFRWMLSFDKNKK
jgi:PhnB protein